MSSFSAIGFLRSDFGRAAQKYFLVGGTCALIDWLLFALLLYGLDVHYLLSGAISFFVSTAANYVLSVRFVFGVGRRSLRQRIILLSAVSTAGIVFNLGLLTVGIDVLGVHSMIAKVFATGVVFGWNFLLRYFFVFQK
jgi:putative flippase GtrA